MRCLLQNVFIFAIFFWNIIGCCVVPPTNTVKCYQTLWNRFVTKNARNWSEMFFSAFACWPQTYAAAFSLVLTTTANNARQSSNSSCDSDSISALLSTLFVGVIGVCCVVVVVVAVAAHTKTQQLLLDVNNSKQQCCYFQLVTHD